LIYNRIEKEYFRSTGSEKVKLFVHIVIFISLISLVFYLYNEQLGAIPFLLLSIYFLFLAISLSPVRLKKKKPQAQDKGKEPQKIRQNAR